MDPGVDGDHVFLLVVNYLGKEIRKDRMGFWKIDLYTDFLLLKLLEGGIRRLSNTSKT